MRIAAVEGRCLPRIDPDTGHSMPGRYAGRNPDGTAIPGGEEVPWCSDYVRAVARGDLAEVTS
jgi:hypothetical protein